MHDLFEVIRNNLQTKNSMNEFGKTLKILNQTFDKILNISSTKTFLSFTLIITIIKIIIM